MAQINCKILLVVVYLVYVALYSSNVRCIDQQQWYSVEQEVNACPFGKKDIPVRKYEMWSRQGITDALSTEVSCVCEWERWRRWATVASCEDEDEAIGLFLIGEVRVMREGKI